MKTTGGSEVEKRNAGERAAELVADGAVVGLGTGSTTAHAIRALGRRVEDGFEVQGIPTSYQSADLAREVGIPLTTLDDAAPAIAIDGADRIAGFELIKGGGAAHTREKLVASAAARLVIVADPSKECETLDRPVPLEVLPAARRPVSEVVEGLGSTPDLRLAERKDGPVVTDNGNLVLDCDFGRIEEPADLAQKLASIPGVLEHGLFVGLADTVLIGTETGVEERERRR
ncbi:ribose-5-phosphate isomerase RpiA [Halalkalicoccus jeotgali]|uniref:Ribose-5-phosphate isomerase A n=1 Tax=Halalkalicoccus jeotgali (strain DSM 18796 / CECT 7217 / JCM 14584 / KCTC 4019 / B3) TaxID=795797 RepID=D8J531_HALJB|nr:ribose-5-phosphate isomerase RpiA [Halalkalicoccus jeotgali]ADJ13612.1 ribose-5-phosphate isomerase A [Halalkalicoccus jeotgali B3]ELY33366.1 ribose-5-phosphate isomerase A [Halalkalicoccus jeotgali B3]